MITRALMLQKYGLNCSAYRSTLHEGAIMIITKDQDVLNKVKSAFRVISEMTSLSGNTTIYAYL